MSACLRSKLLAVAPLLPILVGVGLSMWRFTVEDALGGLACALGGALLTVVAAVVLDPPLGGSGR